MTIIFDGTNGITSPGGDTSNTSHSTPIVRSPSSLTLQTNGSTTAVTIDTSQNVGIGTLTPNGKTEITSTSAGTNTNALFLTNASSNTSTSTSLIFGVSTAPTVRNATIRGINTGGNSIDLAFLTSNGDVPAERMRILNTGNILSLAGGSTTATGTGIAFPATQSASSDANTLDDYEEGTWTPTLFGSGGSAGSQAYGIQAGRYVKIGRFVMLSGYLSLSNKGSWTGQISIGGFPFTVNNESASYSGTTFYCSGMTLPANNFGAGCYPNPNTTNANMFCQNNNGSQNLTDYANQVGNSTQVGAFLICYYSSS